MAERHFADHACEAGALVCAGSGETEVVINNDNLILPPPKLASSVGQGVLACGGFAVMFHLGRARLRDIYKMRARYGMFLFWRGQSLASSCGFPVRTVLTIKRARVSITSCLCSSSS